MAPMSSVFLIRISGSDTAQRRKAAEFSVRPTVPLSPFNDALFCSLDWSIAIAILGFYAFQSVFFATIYN